MSLLPTLTTSSGVGAGGVTLYLGADLLGEEVPEGVQPFVAARLPSTALANWLFVHRCDDTDDCPIEQTADTTPSDQQRSWREHSAPVLPALMNRKRTTEQCG
ncbi:hypothetical protein [Streptomyces angustmyceticus]|uniref:hypothetical protein n=1 Tax=Streptomyces angustmyceticus TaxID=285578 RepID=UPI003814BE6F